MSKFHHLSGEELPPNQGTKNDSLPRCEACRSLLHPVVGVGLVCTNQMCPRGMVVVETGRDIRRL